jgi:hypothetical protein
VIAAVDVSRFSAGGLTAIKSKQDCAENQTILLILKALEHEVAKASLHCSTDDQMILDLKRRILHLRDELEKFRHKTIANRYLH